MPASTKAGYPPPSFVLECGDCHGNRRRTRIDLHENRVEILLKSNSKKRANGRVYLRYELYLRWTAFEGVKPTTHCDLVSCKSRVNLRWGRRDLNPQSTGLPETRLSAPEGHQHRGDQPRFSRPVRSVISDVVERLHGRRLCRHAPRRKSSGASRPAGLGHDPLMRLRKTRLK